MLPPSQPTGEPVTSSVLVSRPVRLPRLPSHFQASVHSTVNLPTPSKLTILPDSFTHSLVMITAPILRPASSHLPSLPLTCALLPTLSPPRTTNRFLLDSRWSRPTSQNSLFLWLTAPMHGLTSRSSRTGTTTGSSKVR